MEGRANEMVLSLQKILPFTSRNCNESMYAQGNSPIIYYNFGKYTMDGMHDIGIENEFSL